jgi:GT2 family glycosyltransferase
MARKRKRNRQPKQGIARRQTKAQRSPTALLDVCMTVFGEWDMLERALSQIEEAAAGLESGYRIILIDNGTPAWSPSDDDSRVVTPKEQAEAVRKMLRPQDQFVRLEENAGYPGGMNTAASKGNSPLILVLTSDVYLEPGSITTMVKEMDNPEVGIVAPLLLFPVDESPHGPAGGVQSAGIAFDINGDPFHIFIGWTPDNPRVNQHREMQAVTGACFMTRRELWQRAGGLATVYGAGTYEDMEFCFAVRSFGAKVVFNPEARGYHYVGGSIKQGAGKGGFPLSVNATIFKGRWAQHLQWDAYRYY